MVQLLGLQASNAGRLDSIPGWGTKILHEAQPKKTHGHTETCMGMFTAALFIIPKHPTTGEWIHCGTSIQSSLLSNRKGKTTYLQKPYMNLKSIILSERSQTQKLHTIHFYECIWWLYMVTKQISSCQEPGFRKRADSKEIQEDFWDWQNCPTFW